MHWKVIKINTAPRIRSDENKKEEEVVPSTVLSDDDLNARIAELGLGKEGGVEDKSTGKRPSDLSLRFPPSSAMADFANTLTAVDTHAVAKPA
jgi:hypothetical protein